MQYFTEQQKQALVTKLSTELNKMRRELFTIHIETNVELNYTKSCSTLFHPIVYILNLTLQMLSCLELLSEKFCLLYHCFATALFFLNRELLWSSPTHNENYVKYV